MLDYRFCTAAARAVKCGEKTATELRYTDAARMSTDQNKNIERWWAGPLSGFVFLFFFEF
jgi:hypothetical protein